MLGMALNSARLFFQGKLFQDNAKVIRQLLLGIIVGAAVLVALALAAGLPLWIAAGAGGLVSGFLQPILFKNLKYA